MSIRCLDFLARKRKGKPVAAYVVFGEEDYLRRLALLAVRELVVGPDPDDFTYSTRPGEAALLPDVLDELFTPPFLGERRLLVVEDADRFVTQHRDALLRYLQSPSQTGVLLLTLRSWPANTKLAKTVEQDGLAIECTAPKAWHAPGWCIQWAASRYGKQMAKPAAEWLVELVGANLGQLDQELCKLATYVGEAAAIDMEAVSILVAGTRADSAFKMLDMVLEGQAAKALEMLDRQLVAGDSPVAIMGMLTSQLRKLTSAARQVDAGQLSVAALADAGVPPFAIPKADRQLRRLGRRLEGMYRRLLQTDLAVKGSPRDAQRALERFLVELARG